MEKFLLGGFVLKNTHTNCGEITHSKEIAREKYAHRQPEL